MPSPSLSALQDSVPIWRSSVSGSRSLSSSVSAASAMPSPSQSETAGVVDRRRGAVAAGAAVDERRRDGRADLGAGTPHGAAPVVTAGAIVGELGRRVRRAEALGEDAQLERGRNRLAALDLQEGEELGRDLDDELRRGRAVSALTNTARAPVALKSDGVAVLAGEEALAADRQAIADLELQRGDRGHLRRGRRERSLLPGRRRAGRRRSRRSRTTGSLMACSAIGRSGPGLEAATCRPWTGSSTSRCLTGRRRSARPGRRAGGRRARAEGRRISRAKLCAAAR